MRTFALVVGLLLISSAAHSETDVFMRAVGFALTGSDDADVKAIDRANCVFGYKNDAFYLNNVHTDRITIQGWGNWINVGLHGDDVVVAHTILPMSDNGTSLTGPEKDELSLSGRKEYEFTLTTGDQARVKRAWEYIYSHGCVGKKSPF